MTGKVSKVARHALAWAVALVGAQAGAAPAYRLVDVSSSIDLSHSGLTSLHYNDAGQWTWAVAVQPTSPLQAVVYQAYFMDAGGSPQLLATSGLPISTTMNNTGTVLGAGFSSGSDSWQPSSWTWSTGGGMHPLSASGEAAYAINDAGAVTGEVASHAFVQSPDGPVRDIQTLDGFSSKSEAINSAGEVVGTLFASDFHPRAFRYTSDAGMTLLPLEAEADGAWGVAVNDAGWIAGTQSFGFDRHAFVWNGASTLDLGLLPGTGNSFAGDINNAGWVVGFGYNLDSPSVSGWLWNQRDGMMSLASLLPETQQGCKVYSPSNINNHGDITALADCGSGQFAALLTPVPEPASAVLAAAGLFALGVARRRRS